MAQLKDLLVIGPSLFNGDVAFNKIPTYNNIELALRSEIAYKDEGVYFVDGSSSSVAGSWIGTSDRITEYYDGLIINYKIGIAGSSDGTTLNINNLGAKTCYLRGTTKITTQYDVGTIVLLSYNASKNAFYSADYDANDFAKVRQYNSATNASYPLLFAYETTSNMPAADSYDTTYTRRHASIYANPSTGAITAKAFKKTGSSDSYVLLGGGGTKAVSDFEVANRCLPLAGSSLTTNTNNMTGAIMFYDCDGIKVNSFNKDLKIWEVYGNSGAYASQYGFDLLYKGSGSGNNNLLQLFAHNETGAHVEVYRVHQNGTTNWQTDIDFLKQPTTSYTGATQKLATEDYVNSVMNAAVVLRGTLGTNGTITALPSAALATLGDAYKVITAGTYNSQKAKVGDMFICYQSATNTYAWLYIPSGDDIEDTWRKIQVNGTDILGSGTSTNALNLKAGTDITLTNNNGTVTIAASHPTWTFTSGTDKFTVTNTDGLNTTVNVYNRLITSPDTRSVKYDTIADIATGVVFDFKEKASITSSGETTGPQSAYVGVMTWRSYGSATDYTGGPSIQIAYDYDGRLWTRTHNQTGTLSWKKWQKLAIMSDIPTVNNSEITITAGNGLTTGGAFTLNQSTAETITLNVGAGTGISVTNDAVGLATSGVTAGTYGQESTVALDYDTNRTFTVPVVVVDTYGRVTSANEYTITAMPHDDTKVNKTGDEMSGSLTFTCNEAIKYKTASRTGTPICFYAGNQNGNAVVIGDGGMTVIGAGESAKKLHTNLVYQGSSIHNGTETMYITSDGGISFYTNYDSGTHANAKCATMDANGNWTMPATVTATTFTGFLDGNSNGHARYLETKYQSEDKWYNTSYRLYAKWITSSICKMMVDNYETQVDRANSDADGNDIIDTYFPYTGGEVTGSLSVVGGTTLKSTLLTHGKLTVGLSTQSTSPNTGIHVHDLRDVASPTADLFGNQAVNFYFDQINDSFGGAAASNRWMSIMHMKGWTDAYAAWELAGNADAGSQNDTLRYRQGIGSSWGAWQSVLTDANFTTYLNDTYVNVTGDTMTGQLTIQDTLTLTSPEGNTEGGQMILAHSINGNNQNGIVVDTANSEFRVFGYPSKQGTTSSNYGSILTYAPYDLKLSFCSIGNGNGHFIYNTTDKCIDVTFS